MTANLKPVQRRVLAVGLLLLLLAAVYGAVGVPLLAKHRQYDEAVEDLEFRLARYQRTIAGRDAWQARLQQIKKDVRAEGGFIDRENPALASAQLQQYVKDLIARGGGQLNSTQVVPAREEGHFTRVAIKVRMNGDTDALREVLYAIESGRPLLMVDDLQVRYVRGRGRRSRGPRDQGELDIGFEVIGYMRTAS